MEHIKQFNYHAPAYVCSHIFYNTLPILYVCRADGDWQFLCGGEHINDEIPKLVGIGHLLDRDTSLMEIIDLQEDWEAEREKIGGKWERRECGSDGIQ